MFYYLNGSVALIDNNLLVIDCGGVGFSVNTTTFTISKVKIGENARLYTYCSIREDAFDIYGFWSRSELNAFKLLISVNGVGPKAAIAILSSVSLDGLNLAVMTQNEKMLTSAPGIGKKTAQRIILELKDKLNPTEGSTSSEIGATASVEGNSHRAEAVQALQALGYDNTFITAALKGLDADAMSVQDIIRHALKKAIS